MHQQKSHEQKSREQKSHERKSHEQKFQERKFDERKFHERKFDERKSHRHRFLQLLSLLAACTLTTAARPALQSPASQTHRPAQASQKPSGRASANGAGRAKTEPSPDPSRLRAHVELLASDKMEGRKTATPGAEAAAAYIGTQLASYGVRFAQPTRSGYRPDVLDAGYLRGFPYVASVRLGKGNAMSFISRATAAPAEGAPATLDLRVGEDWMPVAWSADGRVEALPVSFVGYGIAAAELGHDDYAGTNVEGRVALAFAGVPDDNPHGRLARFTEMRLRAAAARTRGARALVLIAREESLKEDRLARLRYDNAGGDAGLPVVVISRTAARRILEAGGMRPTLDELEQAMRASAATPLASTPPASTSSTSTPSASAPSASTPSASNPPAAPGSTGTASAVATAHPRFSAALQQVALSISIELVRERAPAFNVVGVLEGTDAKLKQEAIIIGAHYDHLGRGGEGSLAARAGDIHHGADDNASGVAAMLELARLLAQERPRRTIIFVAFGGEEEGLLGSNWYTNNPVVPLAQTIAMLNLDMVGRLREERLFIGGTGTAEEWRGLIAAANQGLELRVVAGQGGAHERRAGEGAKAEMPVVYGANGQVAAVASPRERFRLTLNEDGYGPSDHSSFYARKIPVLFFFTGTHEDYHKPTDTADRLDYEGEARIVALIRDLVRAVDASDRRPTYATARSAAAGRSMGFRVSLGTVPSYAESETGLKLDAVRDDSPAARAGLRAGDVIVKLAGREVRNVYDYTQALSEMQAGREYEVEVRRAGQTLSLRITPDARK